MVRLEALPVIEGLARYVEPPAKPVGFFFMVRSNYRAYSGTLCGASNVFSSVIKSFIISEKSRRFITVKSPFVVTHIISVNGRVMVMVPTIRLILSLQISPDCSNIPLETSEFCMVEFLLEFIFGFAL